MKTAKSASGHSLPSCAENDDGLWIDFACAGLAEENETQIQAVKPRMINLSLENLAAVFPLMYSLPAPIREDFRSAWGRKIDGSRRNGNSD